MLWKRLHIFCTHFLKLLYFSLFIKKGPQTQSLQTQNPQTKGPQNQYRDSQGPQNQGSQTQGAQTHCPDQTSICLYTQKLARSKQTESIFFFPKNINSPLSPNLLLPASRPTSRSSFQLIADCLVKLSSHNAYSRLVMLCLGFKLNQITFWFYLV